MSCHGPHVKTGLPWAVGPCSLQSIPPLVTTTSSVAEQTNQAGLQLSIIRIQNWATKLSLVGLQNWATEPEIR